MRSLMGLIVLLLATTSLAAQEVSYSLQGYGGRHAVVILSNPPNANLTASISSDGMSVRVSGTGVNFSSRDSEQKLPALITNAQQVRRGAFSDLLLNLSSPSTLTATPGSQDLKLFIKVKSLTAQVTPSPDANATPSTEKEKAYIPIQFVWSDDAAKMQPGLNVVFPPSKDLKASTPISAELRDIAYGLDLLWSYFSGKPLDYQASQSEPSLTEKRDLEELEKLVRDLTQELVDVRNDLRTKQDEINKLQQAPNQ